jgi:hypothetical protein
MCFQDFNVVIRYLFYNFLFLHTRGKRKVVFQSKSALFVVTDTNDFCACH